MTANMLLRPRITCCSGFRRRSLTIHASSKTPDDHSNVVIKQSIAMFSSGAVLGPMCDGMHSLNGVLAYKEPFAVPLLNFQTCWWVPCLFGIAGWIIGLGVPLLDSLFDEEAEAPEWPIHYGDYPHQK
jgi:hypothetical protein